MKKDTIRFDSADGKYSIEQITKGDVYNIIIYKNNEVVYKIDEYAKKTNGELIMFMNNYIALDERRPAQSEPSKTTSMIAEQEAKGNV